MPVKATTRASAKDVEVPATNGKTTKAEKPTPQPVAIHLTRLVRETIEIPIVGRTPLIMQRWSEKAKQLMLQAQQSSARAKKQPKDPEADYQAAFYRLEDGTPGVPATAFKAAIGSAARNFDGITMTALKTTVFVKGSGSEQLVPIVGEARMREDTPRNANGVADLRYRPEFWPWSCTILVEYLPSMLDRDSVFNLVDAAGLQGIGSWRPSSPKSMSGTYGQFEVDFAKLTQE